MVPFFCLLNEVKKEHVWRGFWFKVVCFITLWSKWLYLFYLRYYFEVFLKVKVVSLVCWVWNGSIIKCCFGKYWVKTHGSCWNWIRTGIGYNSVDVFNLRTTFCGPFHEPHFCRPLLYQALVLDGTHQIPPRKSFLRCLCFSGEITISKHITHIPETNKKLDLSPPPKTFQNSKIQKETPIICICILGKDFAAPQNRLDIVLLISSHCSKVSKHWKSMSQFSVAVKCWVELQEPSSKCLKMSTLDMEDFPCLVVELL